MSSTPVTVLIPALDEALDIEGLLDAVASQTYPADLVEVLLVDGRSSDRTVEVARKRAAELDLDLVVVDNESGGRSAGLNCGLAVAHGEIVVRLDARSRPEPSYVERCVRVLSERPEVGVVGGNQVPRPRSAGVVDTGIARALSNRYTTGLARYRRGAGSGPTDTVWMGAFRRSELRDIGGWDASVDINEDFELNARYRRAGAVVWFEAGLDTGYLPRRSLSALARQYHAFGRAKGSLWRGGMAPSPRQLGLLCVPLLSLGAMVAAVRRWGWVAMGTIPVSILLADEAGCRGERASARVRVASGAAIATYTGAWWSGVVRGASLPRNARRPRPRGERGSTLWAR